MNKKINELTIDEVIELDAPMIFYIYATKVYRNKLPPICHKIMENKRKSNPNDSFVRGYFDYVKKIEKWSIYKILGALFK